MRRLALLLAGWLAFSQSASARDVSVPGWFKCVEGDCKNGTGVVMDLYLHVSIRGRFSGGQTIPGEEYILTSPLAPGRTFKQIYGEDGLLASGDSPRTIGLLSTKIGNFSGTYKAFQHPFTQRPTAVISEGSYDTGLGISYNGQFRFLPSKFGSNTGMGAGYYIFFGDRFDAVENEHSVGLYVSDVAMPGGAVQFYPANPEFLVGMQENYRAEMQLAQTERSASSGFWKSVLSLVSNLALNMSSAGGTLSGLGGGGSLGLTAALAGATGLNSSLLGGGKGIGGQIALNLVSSMFDGKPGINFEDAARSAIASVVPNTAAGNAIASAILDPNASGTNLGSRLVNAAGNAAISNVEGKLSAAVGGSVAGSLATSTLKTALSGAAPGKNLVQGAGQSLSGNVPQTLAGAVAGNQSGQTGLLLGAAIDTLSMRSRERQEAASNAAGYQRADQEISQTITEISAIAKTKPSNTPAKLQPIEASDVPKAQAAAPAQNPAKPSDDTGSVSLTYTPGKGFWDPAANRFIKSPELMSCNNVTTTGVKLIDLPLEKRTCVVLGPIQKAPRPAYAPVPTPQTAFVAQLELISPPEHMEFSGSELLAVNEGFYVALKSDDGMSGAGKYAQDGWYTAKLARGPVEIAIPNHRRQGINEFSLRYIASDKEKGDRYGWMNMNNGAIIIDEENDRHLAVTKYVPLLDDTKSLGAIAVGERKIYWEKRNWVGREFSARYEEHDLSGVSLRLAADTGEHLSVYMVGSDGKSIVNVGVDGTHKERYDLSAFGEGIVTTLIYKHNKLFVGYGDQVLLIKDGKLTQFYKLEGVLITQRATFCIANGNMFAADGKIIESVDTFDKATSSRSFLVQRGTPPIDKMIELNMMRAGIQTGIYCEDGDYYPHVFAFGVDLKSNIQKVMKIYPVQ